jgi:hypothetical protein
MKTKLSGAALALWILSNTSAEAAISGTVRNSDTLAPVAGAEVRLQVDPGGPFVLSGADGSFTLNVVPPGVVALTAVVPYDPLAAINYTIAGADASDGDSGVLLDLISIGADDPAYEPPRAADSCLACHQGHYDEWTTSNHSGAANDFWVLDVFSGTGSPGGANGFNYRDTHDPGETGFCATCHTPMADVFNPGMTMLDEVTAPGALDGVSCVGCHQIDHVNESVNSIHLLGNATYRFPEGFLTERYVWGPLNDVSYQGMRVAYNPIFTQSRFCASCHQYSAPFGQTTYTEWQASSFAVPGPGFRSCQDCHMPARTEPDVICDEPFQPERPVGQRHAHTFVGATPELLASAVELDTTAELDGDTVRVLANLTNLVGHSFPTGVSIRNAFLVVSAAIDGTPLIQTSGPTVPGWADDEVPGIQPGDFGGQPGTGFAKVLEGRINGAGPPVSPVLFIDAETVLESSNLPAGQSRLTEIEFALPPGTPTGAEIEIEARLIYRRAFRALAVTKGWTQTPQGGPIEIEVEADRLTLVNGSILDIPTASETGLLLLGLGLAAGALMTLRRRGI